MSTTSRHAGALDASLEGAVGCVSVCHPIAGGTLHLEPYATDDLSLPTAFSVFAPLEGAAMYGASRLGVRHRFSEALALGIGGGPTLIDDSGVKFGGAVDADVATGMRGGDYALSFVTGLGYAFRREQLSASQRGVDAVDALFLPLEFSAGGRAVDDFWVTGHLLGGLAVGSIGYQGEITPMAGFGAGIGVVWQLDGSMARRRSDDAFSSLRSPEH